MVVVFLLPADPDSGQTPGVGALQAIGAVEATAGDVSGFCVRNPDVCATASAAGEIFSEKFRYGMQLLQKAFGSDADGAAANTLTRDDINVPWRGVQQRGV